MAFKSGVFTSTSGTVNGDGIFVGNKAVDAAFLANRHKKMLGNGISLDPTSSFYVAPKTGLTATVSAGWGTMEGYDFEETTDYDITMTSSTSDQTIYIGVRLDEATGEFTDNHVAARTTFVAATDRVFAIIVIPANAVTLTSAMITDTRNSTTYCGTVNAQRVALAALQEEYTEKLEVVESTGIPIHATSHEYGETDALDPSAIGQYGLAQLGSDSKVANTYTTLAYQTKSANYELVAGDEHKITEFTATANCTIPASTFDVGVIIPVCNSSGTLTIVAGSGVTLVKVGGYASAAANAAISLVHLTGTGTETWLVVGATAT